MQDHAQNQAAYEQKRAETGSTAVAVTDPNRATALTDIIKRTATAAVDQGHRTVDAVVIPTGKGDR